jgi:hypothetical protein
MITGDLYHLYFKLLFSRIFIGFGLGKGKRYIENSDGFYSISVITKFIGAINI